MSAFLKIMPPIDIGEDVVTPLAVTEEVFVDLVGLDLVVEAVEAHDVIFGPFFGVGNHGASFHDKGPVAGLGEEKFAGGLFHGTVGLSVAIFKLAR